MIKGIPLEEVPAAFGKIENQFVGILVGVLSAELYNRFSQVELPLALSFFSGRRLVPILASFLMIIVAFILMYVWPVIYGGLVSFGESIKDMGALGAGIYAFFNRLLIPVGLHHALNSVFWFDVAGINDIPNFLAGQKSIDAGLATVGVTGRYQAGFFPVMMFGLPGAALAIYHCARKENKAKVAGIMMAGAFAAFFTGITEPLEFSFMFVAPVLYVIHAFLMAISVYIAASMEWISGFGFSAGLVDMFLSSRNPLAVHWYMLIVQGIVFFFIYYGIFRFTITKFNLKTPGREDDVSGDETADGYNEDITTAPANSKEGVQQEARQYIAAIGGSDNLTGIDACITRLRLNVKDATLVNDAYAKRLGASGVIRLNKQSVQVIVGTRAELVANAMRDVLTQGPVAAYEGASASTVSTEKTPVKQANANAKVLLEMIAPFDGEIVALNDVPDEAFSSGVVGDGLAIKPTSNIVMAPATGSVVKIFETNHAFCIETDNGVEIIVHMGIDTVALGGKGFKRLVEEGADVKVGQPILELDLEYLNANAKSMISPVIVSNIDDFDKIAEQVTGDVVGNKTIIYKVLK